MKTAVIYDKWLSGLGGGEVVACNMAVALRDAGYSVIFACQEIVSIEIIKKKLDIDMSGIKFVEANNEQTLKKVTHNPYLFINLSFMDYSYGFAQKNIYYVHFPTITKKGILHPILRLFGIQTGLFNYVLVFFKQTHLHSLFPSHLKERIDDRLRAGIYHDLHKRLNSYDTFITHSEYVAKWVKKEWNKNAVVLYPPVKLINKPASHTSQTRKPSDSKHNWICSLGRFFTLGHGKKQEVLIEAFKKMLDQLGHDKTSDLQLHLIGGVGKEPSSIRFVESLKEMAKGYPIFFHFNAPRSEVEKILTKSKIYWHAAGYGEDPEKDPIKFEHFGIAPVEAISAGCIPILFDGGGLREIILKLELDPGKHLFSSLDTLVNITQKIINNNISINWSEIDSKLINNFSSLVFHNRFIQIINGQL